MTPDGELLKAGTFKERLFGTWFSRVDADFELSNITPSPLVGEGRGEGGITLHPYSFHYPFDVHQNFIIPEPEHYEPLRIQPLSPLLVFSLFKRMLTAVSFDDDALFVADKINNESSNLLLATKFQSIKLFGLQAFPQ
jgi:hypothetical protein